MADGTLKVGTITTSSGSGDITIPSGNGMTGHNYPAFLAYRTSNQSLSDATTTTVVCNTEVYDTHNAYDTSTGKFTCPTGKAGIYFFTLFVFVEHNGSNDYRQIYSRFQKNDASIGYGSTHELFDENFSSPMRGRSLSFSLHIKLDEGDTVKGQVYQDNTSSASRGLEQASFSAFRLGAI